MTKLAATLALLLTAGAASAQQAGSTAAGGITLHSESFSIPTNERTLPGGPAADVATANCTTCHSAGMILNQPALSASTWGEEVNKMRTVYKAPVQAEDVAAIVAYLATLKPGS